MWLVVVDVLRLFVDCDLCCWSLFVALCVVDVGGGVGVAVAFVCASCASMGASLHQRNLEHCGFG